MGEMTLCTGSVASQGIILPQSAFILTINDFNHFMGHLEVLE